MACMEHECRDCNHVWFNNQKGGPCPACGSNDIADFFDEQPDVEEEEDEDEDWNEDEDDWDDEDEEEDCYEESEDDYN
ncbi:MAG: hypothetical protein ACWGQW_07785 [bacterium]